MRTLFISALIIAILCAPITAQESKEDLILKKLDELQKSFNDASKELKKDVSKNTEDIKSLSKSVADLREELTIFKNEKYRPKADSGKDEEKHRVPEKNLKAAPNTKAEYEDIPSSKMVKTTDGKTGGNPPEVQYSKIKIINYWHTDYVILINGEKHTVKAKDTLIVDYVMPGSFTYQVVGLSEVRTRDLKPKHIHTITIGIPPTTTQTPVPLYMNQPMYYYPPCHAR